MTYNIIETNLTPLVKERIYKGFKEHSISQVGYDGLDAEPISFEIWQGNELIGACVIQLFWGQLHIKYLYVDKSYRNKGIGKELMEKAFSYGKSKGCNFAFVETLSFQAPDFYQKLGFEIELERIGYSSGTSFCYLRKDL